MASVLIPILDSTDETIIKARNILSMAHNRDIDIIIHSDSDNYVTMYPFIEELIEYRINYTSKKIRAHVPIHALNLACLLCLVADEYYASPDAIFSPFALTLKTPNLSMTYADVEHYLQKPASGSLLNSLRNLKSVFEYYHPRFELIIRLHPKYGIIPDRCLYGLLYRPSRRISSVDELVKGVTEYLSVENMRFLGVGPVGPLSDHIRGVIHSMISAA